MNIVFRAPVLENGSYRNRYEILDRETGQSVYRTIVLDEGAATDVGFPITIDNMNKFVEAVEKNKADVTELDKKFDEEKLPPAVQGKMLNIIDEVIDNSGTSGITRIMLNNDQDQRTGFGYIKFTCDIRSGTTLYSDKEGEIIFFKMMGKVISADITSYNNFLVLKDPQTSREIDIDKGNAMYWNWNEIVSQKFISFKF